MSDRYRIKELRSKISEAQSLLEDIAEILNDYPEAVEYRNEQDFISKIYNLSDELGEVDRRAAHLTFDSDDNISSSIDIDEDEYEEDEHVKDMSWGGHINVGDMYMERGDEDGVFYIWDDFEDPDSDEPDFYTGSLENVKDYNYKLYQAWCKKYNVK